MMNQLVFPVIKYLADGQFHSGEAIAKHFRVSRGTIWNAVQAIEGIGVTVFSVRGRGYKLSHPVTLLDQASITQNLGKQAISNKVTLEIHDTLPSTNSYLMQALTNSQMDRLCVAANLQTQGRGRRGRTWQAGLGESLTFSLLWRFNCGAAGLSGLSLAVGVAIIRALHKLGLNDAKLKWPNDIVVKNKANQHASIEKLAGILIELQGDMEGPSAAVIGVGINLNLSKTLQTNIDQPVTDIAHLQDTPVDPNVLLAEVLRALQDIMSTFKMYGFSTLKKEWLSHHAYAGETVKLIHANGSETIGSPVDIADDGALMVMTDAGITRFSSGEISLRGIN